MRKFKFSLFSSLSDRNPKTITLDQFKEMVLGAEWKQKVSAVRRGNADKKGLPAVTVSGVFKHGHKASNLQTHSSLICMDFDWQDNQSLDVEAIREQLASDQYSRFPFVSAGGKGLAVICEIDPEYHAEAFEMLSGYFKDRYRLIADKSCKDVSRLRFVSWDAEAKINHNSESCAVEHVEDIEKDSLSTDPTPSTTSTTQNVLQRSIEAGRWIDRHEQSDSYNLYQTLVEKKIVGKQGERNSTLTKRLVPFLFNAVSEAVAMDFSEAFYWNHAGIFLDPLDQHMAEAREAWNNCADNYPGSLHRTEAEFYDYLQSEKHGDQLIILFRICRSLDKTDTDQFPVGIFGLSAKQVKLRLGLNHNTQGRRLLDLIHKRHGLIELVKPGKKRIKGKQGIANTYRWMLR